MTPRGLDPTTDSGLVNAVTTYSLCVFALGVWAGLGLGARWSRRRA